jgi:hypothetical protein
MFFIECHCIKNLMCRAKAAATLPPPQLLLHVVIIIVIIIIIINIGNSFVLRKDCFNDLGEHINCKLNFLSCQFSSFYMH